MNGADTLSMTLHDYQASIFHWANAHESGDELDDPPSPDEVSIMFSKMAASGIGSFH